MNYWFIYKLTDGSLKENHLTEAEEWTNIPDGCGVIGPLTEDNAVAADAFQNSDCYTVVNEALTPLPNIADIKAKKEADRKAQAALPTPEDRIASLESALLSMMGL